MYVIIVFECEYCWCILDTPYTSHNCPCEKAPYILKQPPLPHFRIFAKNITNFTSFIVRGERELHYLLDFFIIFSMIRDRFLE